MLLELFFQFTAVHMVSLFELSTVTIATRVFSGSHYYCCKELPVPFHHGMARLHMLRGKDSFQVRRVVADTLSKLIWIAGKVLSPCLEVGR
jgi:hypothetical protein